MENKEQGITEVDIMATTSFGKTFTLDPKCADTFWAEMNRVDVPPTLPKDFKSRQMDRKGIDALVERIINGKK